MENLNSMLATLSFLSIFRSSRIIKSSVKDSSILLIRKVIFHLLKLFEHNCFIIGHSWIIVPHLFCIKFQRQLSTWYISWSNSIDKIWNNVRLGEAITCTKCKWHVQAWTIHVSWSPENDISHSKAFFSIIACYKIFSRFLSRFASISFGLLSKIFNFKSIVLMNPVSILICLSVSSSMEDCVWLIDFMFTLGVDIVSYQVIYLLMIHIFNFRIGITVIGIPFFDLRLMLEKNETVFLKELSFRQPFFLFFFLKKSCIVN